MSVKFFIYCLITILVIWAMDSVNINGIFKKNNETRYASIKIDNPNPNRTSNLGEIGYE